MFIIDFDDTLFNTYSFKQARLKAMGRLGISPKIFWNTYQKARNGADGQFTYSDERHAGILGLSGFDETKVLAALRKVNAKIKSFIFSDAESFLLDLKKRGKPMILLSLGDPVFQEFKVKASGLDKYFDRLFMVERSKDNVLAELLESEDSSAWLVNDKVDEAQQLLFKFKNLQIALKMSDSIPREIYLKSGLPYFSTLSEILNYVK